MEDKAKLVIDTLHRKFDQGFKRNQALENRAANIIQASSLITGLFVAAEINASASASGIEILFLVVIMTLFIVMLGVGMYAWLPFHEHEQPMPNNWGEIYEFYLHPSDDDVVNQSVNDHIRAIETIQEKNQKLTSALRISGVCAILQIVALVAFLIA